MARKRIGIITDSGIKNIKEWDKYLITNLISSSDYEVVSIIKITDILDNQKNFKSSISFSKLTLNAHQSIEKKFSNIPEQNSTFTLNIEEKEISYATIVKSNITDSDKLYLENLNVNIFLNLSCLQIEKLKEYALDGVWEFTYLGKNVKQYDYIGIYEILNKNPTIQIELVRYTKENDFYQTIDCANYNIHWSSYYNKIHVLYGRYSLLVKNLNNIDLIQTKVEFVENKFNIQLISKDVFLYVINLYKNIFTKYSSSLLNKLFGYYRERWGIFVGSGNILDNNLKSLLPIIPPKDEFWADPFLFKYNSDLYLFFERFPFSTLRGRLSCGKIENNTVSEIKDILILDYHLSYPYIFKEADDIFMIPETSENKRLEVYKCVEFPYKWELYSTAFEGESLADTTYYVDNDNQRWLFTNKSNSVFYDHCTELYIYRIDSLKFNTIEPHRQNPVIIDSSVARNGGSIFKHKDKLYRSSQINSYGIYGYGVSINEIKVLNIAEYKEEQVREIDPSFLKGLVGLHHMCQSEDCFVLDGCYNQ